MRRTTGATERTGRTRTQRLIPRGSRVRWTGGMALNAAVIVGRAEVEATLAVGVGAATTAQQAITGVTVVPGQHGIDDSRSHGKE